MSFEPVVLVVGSVYKAFLVALHWQMSCYLNQSTKVVSFCNYSLAVEEVFHFKNVLSPSIWASAVAIWGSEVDAQATAR